MFSAIISARTPAPALHRTIARPTTAPMLRLVVRDDAFQARELLLHLTGVGDQAEQGDEGGDCRKDGEHAVEGDASGEDRDVVLTDLRPHAPENVAPARRRYVARAVGRAPAL